MRWPDGRRLRVQCPMIAEYYGTRKAVNKKQWHCLEE